ncbi:ribonuclease HIII [Candidatus Phytoplasma solani]|uniref:ribonuclease HIII n=1 Tax=Candidatus Phytoplasma solani TaxID=69896 RepID=UPI0032D9BC70
MSNYTLKLNSIQFFKIKKYYEKQLQKKSINKTIDFFVHDSPNTITVYQNGTLLVQGPNAFHKMIFLQKLLQIEHLTPFDQTLTNAFKNSLNKERENLDSYYLESVGCDEVGTGDVFGPVVVCSIYLSLEKVDFFKKMSPILESKQMSDAKIRQIIPSIIDNVIKSIIIIKPSEYNTLIKENNLNQIKALMHNKAIMQTIGKVDKFVPVVLDQFCSQKCYFNYLKDEQLIYKKIQFKTKADINYLSVAIASIIARYVFLQEIDQLSHQLSCKLRLGSGSTVDQQIAEIVKKYGNKILTDIAKCNFKNITHKFKKYLSK